MDRIFKIERLEIYLTTWTSVPRVRAELPKANLFWPISKYRAVPKINGKFIFEKHFLKIIDLR